MKTAALCGIALFCSSAAFAQTAPPSGSAAAAPHSITLTGCVGGGNNAQPITLSNAMVLPAGAQADATAAPSPVPDAVSQPTTQPPTSSAGAAGAAGTTGTAGAAGAAGTTGAAGAAGTAGTTGAAGTTGVAGTAGAPAGSVGASATAAGTAPAGSSASSVSGYRLSGTDMTGWIGRRVQLVGSLVQTPVGTSAATVGANTSGVLPEFRVVSVQPISGDCPRQ